MNLLNRQEFANMWNNISFGFGLPDSPLWIPETAHANQIQCDWFIGIPPIYIRGDYNQNQYYWLWCEEHLQGQVRCFSASDKEEWWGFTNKKDIDWWLLKWAK